MEVTFAVIGGGSPASPPHSLACAWWQRGKQIGTMDERWSVYDARTMARLRAARSPVPRSAGAERPDARDTAVAHVHSIEP